MEPSVTAADHLGLSDQDVQILEFEKQHWLDTNPSPPSAKESAIRQTFSFSAARYYQPLNNLLDREAALAREPVMINRLRQRRDELRTARQGLTGT